MTVPQSSATIQYVLKYNKINIEVLKNIQNGQYKQYEQYKKYTFLVYIQNDKNKICTFIRRKRNNTSVVVHNDHVPSTPLITQNPTKTKTIRKVPRFRFVLQNAFKAKAKFPQVSQTFCLCTGYLTSSGWAPVRHVRSPWQPAGGSSVNRRFP